MTMSNRIRLQHVLQEAEGFCELGMQRHALKLLDRISPELAKEDVEYWIPTMKGECLRGLERYAEAIEFYEAVLEEKPDHVGIFLGLAWCQKRIGRIDLAAHSMHLALVVEPENPLLHYNLACYSALLGEKNAAVESIRQALNLESEYRSLISEETDFDPVRNDPEFIAAIQ